jgi:chromosome segregation ATPase
MTGEALWEVFRKHLSQIEREGDDLAVLVKEVRQIRDHLVSILSESARSQEEIKDWFADIQKFSAATGAKDPESAEGASSTSPARIEGSAQASDLADMCRSMQRVSGRFPSLEVEFQKARESFNEWEIRIQNLQTRQAEIESQMQELRAGYQSVTYTVSLLEDFFERMYDKIVNAKGNTEGP